MILGFLEAHKNESLSSTGPEVLHVDQNYYQGECAPSLLVIEDTGGSVFGALLSTPIRWWQHPYQKKCSDISNLSCSAGRASTFTGQGKVSFSPAGLVGTSTLGLEKTRCSTFGRWWWSFMMVMIMLLVNVERSKLYLPQQETFAISHLDNQELAWCCSANIPFIAILRTTSWYVLAISLLHEDSFLKSKSTQAS